MDSYEPIHILISEEVERLLEDRHILKEDLQMTIHHAETTGKKFVSPSGDRSLAFLRPDRVTYWVEYGRNGDDFLIYNAYSHRMEMMRKGRP